MSKRKAAPKQSPTQSFSKYLDSLKLVEWKTLGKINEDFSKHIRVKDTSKESRGKVAACIRKAVEYEEEYERLTIERAKEEGAEMTIGNYTQLQREAIIAYLYQREARRQKRAAVARKKQSSKPGHLKLVTDASQGQPEPEDDAKESLYKTFITSHAEETLKEARRWQKQGVYFFAGIPVLVALHPALSPAEKMLLSFVILTGMGKGSYWKMERVAMRVGCTEITLRTLRSKLKAHGLINVARNGKFVTMYPSGPLRKEVDEGSRAIKKNAKG